MRQVRRVSRVACIRERESALIARRSARDDVLITDPADAIDEVRKSAPTSFTPYPVLPRAALRSSLYSLFIRSLFAAASPHASRSLL